MNVKPSSSWANCCRRRLEYCAKDGDSFFDAAQNARIVRAAEEYYRLMYQGSVTSWNLRDRHMFDTLRRVMRARSPDAKAVVWAHNSHIGNAAATAMGWQGEFNIGELAGTAFGNDVIAIGFGTDHGRVAAASSWDQPMRIMNVIPARSDSYEALFRKSGVARSLTDWRRRQRQELAGCAQGFETGACDRCRISAGQRIHEPLFPGGAGGAVRRLRLVRGNFADQPDRFAADGNGGLSRGPLATFRRKITGFELAVNGAGKKVARLVGRATF